MIKINKLNVSFKDTVALNINEQIEIEVGDKVGIIGSNGAGKTTLINAIIGMVKYKGTIENEVKYNEIAVHLQSNGYNEVVSIKTIIETIINDKIKNNKKMMGLIDFFEFKHCLKKKFKNLSGGEKQKLTIMLIIMQDAPLTIYDEVTSGLDFETRKNLMIKLNEIYKDNKNTMLLVSHYYEELENLVDKVLLLDKGRLICYGKVDELFNKYCGESIIIVPKNKSTEDATKEFKKITSPADALVLSFNNEEEKKIAIDTLIREKIEFSLKYNDIEIMTLNAKEEFYKGDIENE